MSDRRRYDCLLRDPHPKSRLAFFVLAYTHLRALPSAKLYLRPRDPSGLAPSDAEYYERHNDFLETAAGWMREAALEKLSEFGFPVQDLQPPLPPHIVAVVDELVSGMRAALAVVDMVAPDDTDPVIEAIEPWTAAAYYANLVARGPTAAARYLNDGIPAGLSGVDRSHIFRARHRVRELLPLHRGGVVFAGKSMAAFRLEWILLTCRGIAEVYRQARARSEFRGLRGSELFEAILTRHTFYKPFNRVMSARYPGTLAA